MCNEAGGQMVVVSAGQADRVPQGPGIQPPSKRILFLTGERKKVSSHHASRTSPEVSGVRLHAPNAEGPGFKPWSGKWIPYTKLGRFTCHRGRFACLTKAEA